MYEEKYLMGNTVGSLTSKQHAILVGSLFGDGTLRKQDSRLNALFEVNHSAQYSDYVDWKYEYFQQYVLTKPKARKSNGERIAYRFTTRSLPVFTKYHEWFYKSGKKKIPSDIDLDAEILAVWFMDDGSKSRNAFYLNTQQFSIFEQNLLVKKLEERFKIKSSLNRDKEYHRIYICTESVPKMIEVISEHVLPCFKYKLML